jgi:salicylate hydroxylase
LWLSDVSVYSKNNQYDDLHRLLYRLATSTGTEVTYNVCVDRVSVDNNAETVRAFLENGEVTTADIIIGADGYRSIVRDVVTKRDNNGRPSGTTVLTWVASCLLRKISW